MRENAERKKVEELLTVAVHAFVSKEAFEKLQETVEKAQEQNGKLFDVLNTHNIFTNERLGDLQNQVIELDGKIAGQQAEMRQRFVKLDGKVVGLQTEMRQRFAEQDGRITELDGKVARLDDRVAGLDGKVARLDDRVAGLDGKVAGLQSEMRQHFTVHTTRQDRLESMLTQVLERLPEKP